jgi:serine/threonine protein kinase
MDNRPLARGATLSHYRTVSKLGAGGMGEVCLVQDAILRGK